MSEYRWNVDSISHGLPRSIAGRESASGENYPYAHAEGSVRV